MQRLHVGSLALGCEHRRLFFRCGAHDSDLSVGLVPDLLCLGFTLCLVGGGDILPLRDHSLIDGGPVVLGEIESLYLSLHQFYAVDGDIIPCVLGDHFRELISSGLYDLVLSHGRDHIFGGVVDGGLYALLGSCIHRVKRLYIFDRVHHMPEHVGVRDHGFFVPGYDV